MLIPFHKPSIGGEEKNAVCRILSSGWLTTGEETKLFEEEFAEYVGSKYAVFVNSCTSALKLALEWKKSQFPNHSSLKVTVPSMTFAATVNEVELAGLKPVFCDINKHSLCISEEGMEKAINEGDADLLLPVNYGGNVATQWTAKRTIVDSAHTIFRGCFTGATMCFSFYPTKNMTCGEGGMIVTNDREEYEWYMKARHHGKTKAVGSGYDIEFIGSKYNNTDIAAAIGRVQLSRLDNFLKEREWIIHRYNVALGTTWMGNHLFVVRVNDRDKFISKMTEAGIGTSIHFKPVHQMTAYKKFKDILPVTDEVAPQIVSLPLYPGLTDKEIDYICEKVLETNLLIK